MLILILMSCAFNRGIDGGIVFSVDFSFYSKSEIHVNYFDKENL